MTFPADDRPWGISHAVLAVAAGFAGTLVAQGLAGPELTASELWRYAIPAQAIASILIVAALASGNPLRRETLGLRFEPDDLAGIPIGIALLLGGSLLLVPISWLFFEGDAPAQEVVDLAERATGVDIAVVLLAVGLLGPFAEELVFRGVLLRALIARRGPTFGIYVSATVFALIHLTDPQAWFLLPVFFVMGIVFARQVVSTGRLARALLGHAAFNTASIAGMFLLEEGSGSGLFGL
jgi:membrane protease YdiL (CAAX protease family)